MIQAAFALFIFLTLYILKFTLRLQLKHIFILGNYGLGKHEELNLEECSRDKD